VVISRGLGGNLSGGLGFLVCASVKELLKRIAAVTIIIKRLSMGTLPYLELFA
jgi:hypothetical protein